MKEFLTKLKSEITLEKVIIRLIMAWILTSLCFFMKSDGNFATAMYAEQINTLMFICYIVLFFISFCALSLFKVFTWVETFGPTILITVYGIMSVQADTKISYVIGLMIILAVAIMYAINKTRIFVEFKRNSAVVIIYVLAICFYIAVTACVCICRHLSYRSGTNGFEIIIQMFHGFKTNLKLGTTLDMKSVASYFMTDFSPIYYLFLPMYCVFPYPVTLLVMQVITVASGIVPVYFLCKKFNLSKSATVAFAIVYALYPALACGCYTDLHVSCFYVPLLLWLLYFIEKDDLKMIIAMSVLTLMVREDAVVYLASIGLYLLIGRKKYAKGTILTIGSIGFYIVFLILLNRLGNTAASEGFSNYIVSGEGTLIDVFRNFVVNPGFVIQECFSQDKLQFMLFMFLPVGFMAVFGKKVTKLILLLPMIFLNLAPDFYEKYSIFYSFAFGVSAILIYMSISNYSEMEERTKRLLCAVAICASVIFLPTGTLSQTQYIIDYMSNRSEYKEIDEMIAEIPDDASVIASPAFLAHVSARDEVYAYPSDEEADIILLDSRDGQYNSNVIEQFREKGYYVKEQKKDLYVLLEHKSVLLQENEQ